MVNARALAGRGLVGDRYYSRSGTWSDYPDQTGMHLTLIEAEVLKAVGLSGAEARRNVVTRGIRLNELVGDRFRIGAVVCAGIRLCEPCTHLSQLTGIPVEALVHRGGLRADILSDGEIAVGDLVALI
jgi:MOSC domain-containing protein YiiM